MSTKFTRSSPRLPLGQMLINAQQWIGISLMHGMQAKGFADLSAAHLQFLANLNCGLTHAAAVARAMGISRQAVYRTTRELEKLNILRLENDPDRGNQKIIVMTKKGEAVARAATACLSDIEKELEARIGKESFRAIVDVLRKDWLEPL